LLEQSTLFRECVPENAGLAPETDAFYRWKFQSFPDDPHSYEYIARDDDGSLVGYYAALPFEYSIGSTPLPCGMVCDVMTSPHMRGKGVFTKLGAYSLKELKAAGVDFVTGYPIRPEVIPGHLKVGWEIAFKLPMYLFPMCVDTLLAQRKLGFLSPPANALLLMVYSWWSFCRMYTMYNIKTLSELADIRINPEHTPRCRLKISASHHDRKDNVDAISPSCLLLCISAHPLGMWGRTHTPKRAHTACHSGGPSHTRHSSLANDSRYATITMSKCSAGADRNEHAHQHDGW